MRLLFWRRKQRDAELDEEIAFDLAADAEERVRSGVPREEAEQASRRDFGNISMRKEDVREVWGWTWLQRFGQDLRYGWRTWRKNPLFVAIAVLSLALGIGANTAIFSVMNAVMLRALPVRSPGELAILNWQAKGFPSVVHSQSGGDYNSPDGGKASPDFPWPAYELLRNHNNVFSSLFAFKPAGRLNLIVQGQARLGEVEFVSGNFFSGLGIAPATGRLIEKSDNHPGAAKIAVLSYGYWRTRFDADPKAIGQIVQINKIPFMVAGVAPPGFFGVRPGLVPQVYIPIAARPSLTGDWQRGRMFIDPHFYWVHMMGRLRHGITLSQAQTEIAARFHEFVLASATKESERSDLPMLWLQEGGSGLDALRREYSKPLFVLMAMVGFILAIACANIANLLLARAAARRREMAVRLSLGASRPRVVRQLLTESLMLALPGGILGLAVAAFGTHFLVWFFANGHPDFSLHASLDGRILAFTVTVAFVTGILFGLAPAMQATRIDITPALKESRASTPRKRGRWVGLGQMLVATQIALSLLLVLGAAIFVHTLANLHSVAIGFNQQKLLTFSLDASQAGYKDAAQTAFYARMDERFRAIPSVLAATITDIPLVSGLMAAASVHLPGTPTHKGPGGPSASFISVGPTFFATMQLPILLGRAIDAHDTNGAPHVAVVNEVFAKKYFPNQNPVGRRFHLLSKGDLKIVGVAKNARYRSITATIPALVYMPYLQHGPPGSMYFELRTVGNPLALAGAVRKIVHKAAPDIPVTNIMTQTQRIDSTITQQRTFADLCTAFAFLALVIACVGLYGAMSYEVSRRTNEIGIRMALGAERRRIVWMVLREVLALAAAGLAVGYLCAWFTLPVIKSFVFGMKPTDPATTISAIAIIMAAVLLAGLVPALRASRIDPVAALRHE